MEIPRRENAETGSSHLSKRHRLFHYSDLPATRRDIYTIAWICALSIELAAARAVLDVIHDSLHTVADDSNTYVLGSILGHNVVIACLPANQYGIVNAASVVTNMKRTFTAIRVGLMVGIGGGVPSKVDMRLGDIVVGTRVMQTDLGKILGDGQFERTAIARNPHQLLLTTVSALRAKHELGLSQVPHILQLKLEGYGYGRPSLPDRLFHTTYHHEVPTANCDECDHSKLVLRSTRVLKEPVVHYGAIASGSQVIKNSAFRDEVARQLNVICFEMEAAGLMDILPCLPIRGICDYSDSHKNKEWQKYAAATAAAYARELLEELPIAEAYMQEFYIPSSYDLDEIASQELRKRLDSLRFSQIDTRQSTIKEAHAKTCRWFLSHPDYKAWLDPGKLTQHHGFLWISGKPGAGKSTIMKFAYSEMKDNPPNEHAVIASFFFNARGKYLESSVLGMYRSLLLQLLEGYPDLQTTLNGTQLVPDQNQNQSLPLNVLKEVLYKAILLLGQRSFTCFIDALDECDEQQVLDMIQYLEDLAEQSAARQVPFRVCFSSRHYPYIIIRQGTRLTLEHQPGHTKDLEAYVKGHLRAEDPEIIHKLLQKAAGVFMWVVLVVEILNREYARGAMSLQRTLEGTPSRLSDLFKDMVRRDNENLEELLLCFLWILCAKNPLRPEEFYHAQWSGLLLQGLVDKIIPDASTRDTSNGLSRSYRYAISCSKGLAEIAGSDNLSVQFIHESVQDFLIKDKGLYELWPELGLDWESQSHEKLKRCCIVYMTHPTIREFVRTLSLDHESSNRTETSEKYPFLQYAYQNVLYHANSAAKVVPQDNFLSSFHISDWINVNNLFGYTPYDASLLYILADKGYLELTRLLIDQGADVNFGCGSGRAPLLRALEKRHEAVANLLIERGAIINVADMTGHTPLSQALMKGYEAMAKLLIERGADVNVKDETGRTPLQWALVRGKNALVELLIQQVADINASDETGWKPLQWASAYGHDSVVRLLIEQGADVNLSDETGCTPLLEASAYGHDAVVRLLIEQGADVNVRDETGCTPLSEASHNGHKTVTDLLIERGANVITRDAN